MGENFIINEYILPEKILIGKKVYKLISQKTENHKQEPVYINGYWNAADKRWGCFYANGHCFSFMEIGLDKQQVIYNLKDTVYHYEQYLKNKNRR